jgi:bifunctional non-homologous end joining protein LigD
MVLKSQILKNGAQNTGQDQTGDNQQEDVEHISSLSRPRYNKRVLPSVTPAKLTKSLAPFDDPDWLFELKHDGFRSLAYVEDGRCRLVSRHRNVYKSFENLRETLAKLKAESAILDGEIVCLDENGCSQFKELLYRRGRAVFFAFDLLWLDGEGFTRSAVDRTQREIEEVD